MPDTGRLQIGDIEMVGLSDGELAMSTDWYVNIDWELHADMLGDDGKFHIPIGCYLVRTAGRTVLLDTGMGPRTNYLGTGGQLLAGLAGIGVSLSDIDTVVLSHLHVDHAGGLLDGDNPRFPNATVHFGAGDWDAWVTSAHEKDPVRRSMERLSELGRLEPMEGDMLSIAPGLTARFTPGHTAGHYALILSSGDDRAYLLGDAVECPLQLEEPDFYILSDMDLDLARQTREAMWREVEGTPGLVGAAHFPGLQLGRVLPGQGRRYFQIN
jgi:glyoxylase-like metal-dependent hydrolase (beta-lactamase superfamily II)